MTHPMSEPWCHPEQVIISKADLDRLVMSAERALADLSEGVTELRTAEMHEGDVTALDAALAPFRQEQGI